MKWLILHTSTASTKERVAFKQNPFLIALAFSFVAFWITCFLGTTDRVNWYIENLLVIIFAFILITTYKRFKFSNLSYGFMFLFLALHTYGAKYAYADNPFGFWLQHGLHLWRNPYDRIVHTSFGLLMVYPIRDLLMNRVGLRSRMLWVLPVEIILSLAGLFELIEWSIADVFFPAHGKNYVGTQGDIGDAQKDMVVALFGAMIITAIIYVTRKNYKPSVSQPAMLPARHEQ